MTGELDALHLIPAVAVIYMTCIDQNTIAFSFIN